MATATSGWAFGNDVVVSLNGGLSATADDPAYIQFVPPAAPYQLPPTSGPVRLKITDGDSCNSSRAEIIEVKWDGKGYVIKGRGLEGTPAISWPSGSVARGVVTAEQMRSLGAGGAAGVDTYEIFGKTYNGTLPNPADATAPVKRADGTSSVQPVPLALLQNSINPATEPDGLYLRISNVDWLQVV